jgi:hypothetical protein
MSVSLLYERNTNGRFDWLLKLRPTDFVAASFRVYEPLRSSIDK